MPDGGCYANYLRTERPPCRDQSQVLLEVAFGLTRQGMSQAPLAGASSPVNRSDRTPFTTRFY